MGPVYKHWHIKFKSIFYKSNSEMNNPFSSNNNTNSGGNIFSNNSGNNNNNNNNGNNGGLFNNNQQSQGNPFGNNSNNNNGGNNLFSNNNGNMFQNNNQTNNNSSNNNNIFGNNSNNGGNNLFGNNNSSSNNNTNNLFGNNTNSNNNYNNNSMFGNSNTGATSMFGRPNANFMNNNDNSLVINEYLAFQTSLENVKMQLEDCSRRMSARNIQNIRLDSWNLFKDKPMNKLPFKEEAIRILYNFNELKKMTDGLKKSNQEIEKKMNNISKDTHKKLAIYKKCLLQTVSHSKLMEEVSNELQLMSKQMEDYFKPLYNSYKLKKKISIKEPNEFDLKMSYDVLNKLEILNQSLDDMIASEGDREEVQNTITMFDQLILYYQNVSSSFNDFSFRYNSKKKAAIEKARKGSYESVMGKVVEKVEEKLKKEFKFYDLIKEIDDILEEKNKREERKLLENQNKFEFMNYGRTY